MQIAVRILDGRLLAAALILWALMLGIILLNDIGERR